MLDLFKNQYDLKTLKENIYAVSLRDILKTQKLTSEFCVKYILNTNYQMCKEDENITVQDVLKLQSHINKQQLLIDIINYTSDDDSYEDFESVSKRRP